MLSTAGAKTSLADITGMTAAVQGFLNNVVAAAGYGAAVETPEQLKQSVAAAIGPRHSMELPEHLPGTPAAGAAAAGGSGGGSDSSSAAAAAGGPEVSSSDEEEDEKNTFHLAPATSSDVAAASAAAAATASAAAGSSSSGAEQKLANGSTGLTASSSGQAAASTPQAETSSSSGQVSGRGVASSVTGGISQGKALLLKDAFLVFRALCKLSIRTSDSVTISDPTAVRGKVRDTLCYWDGRVCFSGQSHCFWAGIGSILST